MKFSIFFTISLAAATVSAGSPWQEWGSNQCSPATVAFATGIRLNIVGQVTGEAPAIAALQVIESQTPVNQTACFVGKGELIATIMGGINIRNFNLAIAPANNPALAGENKYAAAQLVELALSQSLTCVPSHDNAILATLASDVAAGTQLNYYNLGNATEGCDLGFVFPPATV